jgi:hypothetical protein
MRLAKLVEANVAHIAEKVVRIERRQYFTKYGFIPAPDGSFYDIGFGALLEDITATIDTTLNQMLDAGALQNAQGGFLGSGVNIKGGDMKFRLGEWKRVDVTAARLRRTSSRSRRQDRPQCCSASSRCWLRPRRKSLRFRT